MPQSIIRGSSNPTQPSTRKGGETFTGDVYLDSVFNDSANGVLAVHVTFTPCPYIFFVVLSVIPSGLTFGLQALELTGTPTNGAKCSVCSQGQAGSAKREVRLKGLGLVIRCGRLLGRHIGMVVMRGVI